MTRDYTDYLYDIYESMKDIAEFIHGLNYESFLLDRKTSNAVIRSLEVMGEAAKKIPKEFRVKYPGIPWKRMAGMRDKLIHEYFGVDLEIVWAVATEEIPPLTPEMKSILRHVEPMEEE